MGRVEYYTHFVAPLSAAEVVVDTVSGGLLSWNDDEDVGKAVMEVVRQNQAHAESVSLGERTAKGLFSRDRRCTCQLDRQQRMTKRGNTLPFPPASMWRFDGTLRGQTMTSIPKLARAVQGEHVRGKSSGPYTGVFARESGAMAMTVLLGCEWNPRRFPSSWCPSSQRVTEQPWKCRASRQSQ